MLPVSVHAGWYKTSFDAMGTVVEIELWAELEASANGAFDEARAEITRLENLLSPYIETSEVSLINRAQSAESVNVSEETFAIIRRALEFSRLSDGAFDISFAAAGAYYDYRAQQQPDLTALEQLKKSINFEKIVLTQDDESQSVALAGSAMAIDLGGIAKGFTVDRVADIFRGLGIESAALSIGGDSIFIGDRGPSMRAGGRLPWVVGIKHPRTAHGDQDVFAFRMPVNDVAFSTSGDYERYFINDAGERVHHILDPSSGLSADGVVSVSVLGPESLDCDALSTSLFVLGVEEGIALIERIDDYEAILIDSTGKMHYSSGLAP